MAKYKVKTKKEKGTTIIQKISRKEIINEREMAIFEDEIIDNLFSPQVIKKNELQYFARVTTSLKDYIKKSMSIHKMYSIIVQTIEVCKTIERYSLYLPNLVLDINYIFVQEISGHLLFIYQPIQNKKNVNDLFSFLGDFVAKIKTDDRIFKDHCKCLLEFFKNPEYYKISDLEKYIDEKYPQIYQEFIRKKELEKTVFEEQICDDICEETALLIENNTISNSKAYIINKKNGIKYEFVKRDLLIGKSDDVDIKIENNSAISRHHARVYNNSGAYFVIDEESKNHTYVNGQIVYSNNAMRLKSGDIIRVADEEFEFRME